MPTDTAAAPASQAIVLEPTLRRHRCEVARFALAEGLPLNIDAITVILAAKQVESATEKRPFTRWTQRGLVAFLWGTATEWCAAHGVELPPTTAESLWTYLTFLFEHRELASGSARLTALREALCETADVNREGRALRPTARRGSGGQVRPLRARSATRR